MRRAPLLALLLAAACGAGAAPAEEVELRSGRQELRIALRGGLPVAWTSCDSRCADAGQRRRVLVGTGEGTFDWVAGSAENAARLAALEYRAEFAETPELVRAELTALEPLDGRVLVQRYELSKTTHEIQLRLEVLPGAGMRLATGPGFIPPPLPGFGAAFAAVAAVRVTAGGQDKPGEEVGGQIRVEPAAGEWLGVRSRFWAWLAQGPGGIPAIVEAPEVNRRALTWLAPGETLELRFYAGPVEWQSLRVVSADLTQMLFAALWEPLRWLCFGLLFLLAFLGGWIPSAGLAIIALSLVVKLILAPLTRIADRWQQEVNRIQSRLQPRLAAIRREHRGEEAHRRTLEVYREEGVHPLFTLKSLAGFAIQVPMFIAAFDMLADNYALAGARFLWIEDLAAPDRFLPLPFALPFFGADFNLLPLVMTALTIVSALVQRDDSLSAELLKKQQGQLYLMAAGFFLLFYTFPAGMVLYWTANNAWHLLKLQLARLRAR